jgi:hypothetical protein
MSVQIFSQAEFSYSDDQRNNRKHAVAHPVLKLLPLVWVDFVMNWFTINPIAIHRPHHQPLYAVDVRTKLSQFRFQARPLGDGGKCICDVKFLYCVYLRCTLKCHQKVSPQYKSF